MEVSRHPPGEDEIVKFERPRYIEERKFVAYKSMEEIYRSKYMRMTEPPPWMIIDEVTEMKTVTKDQKPKMEDTVSHQKKVRHHDHLLGGHPRSPKSRK
jgi:hypothetical protein